MDISTALRMETLPVEIVERIFTYLDLDTLDIVVSVCVSWSKIITRRHFHPYLAAKEYSFGKYLARNGWTLCCSDVGLITKLFRKVRQSPPVAWVISKPTVRTKILYQRLDSMLSVWSMVYKDKLYVSNVQRKVEVYSLETLEMMYCLEIEENKVEYEYSCCQLSRHDIFGLVSTHAKDLSKSECRRSSYKIWLFNLESVKLIWRIETKEPFLCLVMNNTMLVGLFGSSCCSWMIASSLPVKVENQPKEVFPSESKIRRVTINSKWLVALVLETASETSTFQVRQLGPGAEIGEVKKLKCLAIPETHYVGRILLGGENLLAVLEINESGHIPPEFYENFVKVVDAKTDTVLASFNQVVMDTVSWSDDWLFLKECWTSCSGGSGRERLGMWWNVWTGETVNIDIDKHENGDDDFVDSTVEVETTRLTKVASSFEGIPKILVYEFSNKKDADVEK